MNSTPNESPQKRAMHANIGRLARLALKELRESLRDRRTILTLLIMPLLVYPLLSVVFQKFLLTSIQPLGDSIYLIAVESEEARGVVERHLGVGEFFLLKTEKREQQPDASFSNTKTLKRKKIGRAHV